MYPKISRPSGSVARTASDGGGVTTGAAAGSGWAREPVKRTTRERKIVDKRTVIVIMFVFFSFSFSFPFSSSSSSSSLSDAF